MEKNNADFDKRREEHSKWRVEIKRVGDADFSVLQEGLPRSTDPLFYLSYLESLRMQFNPDLQYVKIDKTHIEKIYY
jgi:hypothetical protein